MTAQEIFNEAVSAANAAYESVGKQIDDGPDKFEFVESDIFNTPLPNAQRYRMKELCGFAWVKIPTERKGPNRTFLNELKKLGICSKDINDRKAEIKSDYYGGYQWYASYISQGVDRKYAAAKAFAKVLNDNGIRAYAQERLD